MACCVGKRKSIMVRWVICFMLAGVVSTSVGLAADVTPQVYVGTSFADVNDATRDDPKGVLVSQD